MVLRPEIDLRTSGQIERDMHVDEVRAQIKSMRWQRPLAKHPELARRDRLLAGRLLQAHLPGNVDIAELVQRLGLIHEVQVQG